MGSTGGGQEARRFKWRDEEGTRGRMEVHFRERLLRPGEGDWEHFLPLLSCTPPPPKSPSLRLLRRGGGRGRPSFVSRRKPSGSGRRRRGRRGKPTSGQGGSGRGDRAGAEEPSRGAHYYMQFLVGVSRPLTAPTEGFLFAGSCDLTSLSSPSGPLTLFLPPPPQGGAGAHRESRPDRARSFAGRGGGAGGLVSRRDA